MAFLETDIAPYSVMTGQPAVEKTTVCRNGRDDWRAGSGRRTSSVPG
jgi:hypothetical protein